MADITPEIASCLESELASLSSQLPPIFWENSTTEDPESAEGYVKSRFVPTDRRASVAGTNPEIRYQGYFLVEIFAPRGSGASEADGYASLIIDHFETTTDFSYNNIYVTVRYAERDLGQLSGNFYKVPVRIGYLTYN